MLIQEKDHLVTGKWMQVARETGVMKMYTSIHQYIQKAQPQSGDNRTQRGNTANGCYGL